MLLNHRHQLVLELGLDLRGRMVIPKLVGLILHSATHHSQGFAFEGWRKKGSCCLGRWHACQALAIKTETESIFAGLLGS